MSAVRTRERRRAIDSSDEQAYCLARRDDSAWTNRQKNLMLEAMLKCKCNISAACREVGISRQTHHNWLKGDPDYEQAINDLDDEMVHNMESLFYKWAIEKKSLRATQWFLERRDRKRYGRNERIELTGADGGPISSEGSLSITSLRDQIPDESLLAALGDVLDSSPELRAVVAKKLDKKKAKAKSNDDEDDD